MSSDLEFFDFEPASLTSATSKVTEVAFSPVSLFISRLNPILRSPAGKSSDFECFDVEPASLTSATSTVPEVAFSPV